MIAIRAPSDGEIVLGLERNRVFKHVPEGDQKYAGSGLGDIDNFRYTSVGALVNF